MQRARMVRTPRPRALRHRRSFPCSRLAALAMAIGTAFAHQVGGYAVEMSRDQEGIGVNQRLQTFVMAGAIALLAPLAAMAQEATPAANDLFANLGLPELTVTYTDAGLQVDQSEIPAGRYHVHFVSESSNPNARSEEHTSELQSPVHL